MDKLTLFQIFSCLIFVSIKEAHAQTSNTSNNPNQTTNNACNIKHCITCSTSTQECTQCETNMTYDLQLQACINIGPCPLGQYKTSPTSPCQDCYQTCKSCYDGQPTSCYDCVDGYVQAPDLYSNKLICVSCTILNCRECFSKDECSICEDGFLLNKNTGLCEPCQIQNCQDCSGDKTKCNTCLLSYQLQISNNQQICVLKGNCQLGYYQDSQGNCSQKCDVSCLHCFSAGNSNCYQCAQGYYQSNKQCLPCSSNCQTCQKSDHYCTSCPNNMILSGSACIQKCNYGEYNNNGFCQPCPPNCVQCIDGNTCTACTDKTQFQISNGQCVGVCQNGYYNQLSRSDMDLWQQFKFQQIVSQPNCQKCNSSCATCSVYQNNCTSCKNGYLLNPNNYCQNQCNSSQFLFYDPYQKQSICMQCPYPCGSCKDQFTCTSCISSDFTLDSTGACTFSGYNVGNCKENQVNFSQLCLDSCPTGTILQGDTCMCDYSCNFCLLQVSNMITECVQCNNPDYFQSQGVCSQQCPQNLYQIGKVFYYQGRTPYFYNSCVAKCPQSLFSQVSINSRQCVQSCTSGYTQIQNMCVNTPCTSQQFFDTNSYSNDQNLGINNKSLTSYCISCDPSCSNCDSQGNQNCLGCATGYYQQIRFPSTGGQPFQVCTKTCDQGYIVPPGSSQCKQCQSQCQVCASGLYSILSSILHPQVTNQNVYDCLQNCPPGTVAQNNQYTCNVNTEIDVIVDYTNSVDNLFCVQSNINIALAINTIQSLTQNPKYNCTVAGLNLPIQMQNINQGQYTKFNGVIPANTLQEDQSYNITCNVTMNNVNYSSSQQISTFKLIPGNFTVDQTSGTALNQTFYFSISGFYLDNISPDDYLLQYQISAQMSAISYPYNNYTIFQTNDQFFRSNPDQALGLNYTYAYTFPQIFAPANITIYLTVYGVSALQRVYNLTINLQPCNQTQNQQSLSTKLQQIINQLNVNQNAPINLTSLIAFTQQLQKNNIVPSLDLGQKQAISIQKMISNQPFIDIFITCNAAKDCSGQGTCKQNITSYYNKCDCFVGFSGEICSWSTADLNLVQMVYNSFLDQSSQLLQNITLNPTTSTNILSNLINQMYYLVQIRDVFNSDIMSKFMNLLNSPQIYTNSNAIQSTGQLLSINDFAIDILRKASSNGTVTQSLVQAVQNNFVQTLYLLQNNLQQGQQMTFSLNNVNAQIQDLTYANYQGNQQIEMTGDGMTPQTSWDLFIPTSVFGYQAGNLYAQAIVYPCDLQQISQQNYTNTTYNLVASNIIDITIRSKSNMQQYQVQNTQTPIQITLQRQITQQDMQFYQLPYTLNCTYQLQDGTWTSNGLKTIDNGDGTFTCVTNHLTNFAVQIESYNPNYYTKSSDNKSLSSSSSYQFQQSLFIVLNFVIIITLGHVWGIVAIKRDKIQKRRQSQIIQQQVQSNSLIQKSPPNQQNGGVTININQDQQIDSIFNQQQQFQYPPQQKEMKLEGIHVTHHREIEKEQMIAGVPIFGDATETQKVQIKSKSKISKLQIDQVNIDNANMVSQNPEQIDKIAQNLARRLKEQEIDMANQDDQSGEPAKNFKEKEVNIIPISTFYQQPYMTNQASPQMTLLQNPTNAPDQIVMNDPYTLEVSPNIIQGVPIQENNEQRERAESLRKYVEKLDKNKQYIDKAQQEKLRLLIYYHPIFSFTHPLPYVTAPVRTILFFQFIAIYEWLTLSSVNIETPLDSLTFGVGLSIFFQVLIGKAIIQYVIPAILYILATIEKICTSQVRYSYSSFLKYIFILTLTVYCLVMFSNLTSSNINTLKEFTNFIALLIITIIADYFVIDFFIIKLQQSCNSVLMLKLIKAKNLCLGES
ncbi:latrophilin/CL-like GPS domain protein (macronuclear) [Tetrahymena thermophila SB210]|uniref:Latrophilin/CL-like GPS domain protein n=1 Tax=Tetrahymena thermophila (strain SB210) TaxID=312017 RepID=I7MB43_TETTS|nr:latrophilin/CL-like GPS domain protein [Tetrahymena thermophila SB210]EAS07582.2 latrophilin/CL-like GPS domain protein [Tetrahymena thermophila SB210]|eukprot:XP_001027824.2 latrophilin/CL-like GPS domain protein [Tetrahymena thermophila SB210]